MMNTTKLNKTTKRAIDWIRQYEKSDCLSVQTFYKNCSLTKIEIEREILVKMDSLECVRYRVLNGNCFHFVAGYLSQDKKTLYIETASNTFEIAL